MPLVLTPWKPKRSYAARRRCLIRRASLISLNFSSASSPVDIRVVFARQIAERVLDVIRASGAWGTLKLRNNLVYLSCSIYRPHPWRFVPGMYFTRFS